ncbi:MAG: winged helix-turn-helix domain-containing protein [Candidatus Bathyarchaeia archaeon]
MVSNMRRSKLETYIDILSALANRGPLKITHISYKANLNFNTLQRCIKFLVKQNLVEEKVTEDGRRVYAITPKGINAIKAFIELKQALPIDEEPVRIPIICEKSHIDADEDY